MSSTIVSASRVGVHGLRPEVDRKAIPPSIKAIYQAESADTAL